ncbi:MAG: ribosomal RNA small subunit methyltransferase A [Opitutae bacterium]|nr:ribosomal RNA small subunit methyltransferase A [Opitutae bacterium]
MPLSPSETTRLLDSINHRPKKKLGQNFLIDGNIVRKSLIMADLPYRIPVVEIGPGLGTLTKQLLDQNHPVFAVEIDTNLFANLKDEFSSFIEQGKLNLINGDAVKNPVGSLPDEVNEFAVVANLPYAISSPWMESLLNSNKIPNRMVLMLQKEAVDRMNASHGTKHYNALTIFLRSAFKQTQTHPVPRQCFHPVPGIDSMLVRLDRLKNPFLFSKDDRVLIRKIFTQRRKQIGALAKKENTSVREIMLKWLDDMNLPSNFRPEQIKADAWRELSIKES